MRDFLKYLPTVGFLFAIWSLFSQDWFGVGFGLLLFFGGFVVFLRGNKQKETAENESLLEQYLKAIDDLAKVTLEQVYKVDLQHPKAMIARGLFLIGAIDSATQAAKLADNRFVEFSFNFLRQAGFSTELARSIVLFHQGMNGARNSAGYKAILMGGHCFVELVNGNKDAPLGGAAYIKEEIDNPNFPNTI